MVDLAQLEPYLNSRLLGQREAISDFCSALVRAECGPRRSGRTRAFLLLLGPTGTGKTEMVSLAARFLYGTDASARLERFDMGEYQHPDSVKRLLGAPDQPPLLGLAIDRLNRAGGGILLLDEIEKAFPDLLTALLSFDSARSTMFDGTTRDLTKLVIVLTSNLGAAEAARMENSGYSAISRKLRHAAEERFRKEGVARFTAVICMNVLSYDVQERITRSLLEHELNLQSVHARRQVVAYSDVVTFLISRGFSPDLGARNIRNCVERFVGDAMRKAAMADGMTSHVGDAVGDRWSSALVLTRSGDELAAHPLVRSAAMQEVCIAHSDFGPMPRFGTASVGLSPVDPGVLRRSSSL